MQTEQIDRIYDDEWLNNMWQRMWDETNLDWNPSYPAIDDFSLPPPAIDSKDEVDQLLADDDKVVVPSLNEKYWGYPNDIPMDFTEYNKIVKFNEETGEWDFDAEKFNEQYQKEEDEILDQIQGLNDEIDAAQDVIDADKQLQDQLVDEALVMEDVKQGKFNVEDIVSIDPETGKLVINEEAYRDYFGFGPSLDVDDYAFDAKDDAVMDDLELTEPSDEVPAVPQKPEFFGGVDQNKEDDFDVDKWWRNNYGDYKYPVYSPKDYPNNPWMDNWMDNYSGDMAAAVAA